MATVVGPANTPLPANIPLPPFATTRRAWRRLLPLLLAVLLGQLPLAAAPTTMASPQASAPRPQAAEEVRDSGSFHRAKVRILGIPVLTVASPVMAAAGGPDARQRAQVIEGNLELLYRAQEVCTEAEGLAEFILDKLYLRSGQLVCDSNQLGLLGNPTALQVEVAAGSGGPPVLQARVPGRELPLPLLSVTAEDARLNGTTPDQLAQRWCRGCWGAAFAPWRCWSWGWGECCSQAWFSGGWSSAGLASWSCGRPSYWPPPGPVPRQIQLQPLAQPQPQPQPQVRPC